MKKHFIISINGAPTADKADKLWTDISGYEVNFTVLTETSYIYGDATDAVVDDIIEKVGTLGFTYTVERG